MAFGEERVLEIVLKARDEASKQIQEVGKEASAAGKILSGSFRNAAIVSGVALGALTVEAVRSIKAFDESQQVTRQLEAVLKSTNGVAGITRDRALELASAFQRQTAYSDEAVLSAENLLLTFTSIGKDIFPKALETVLDMSTALGQDTKASAIQLGKALQDPILGVTALRRVGVNFSEDQQNVIAKLVETGQKAKAQQLIMKELATEFGGSSANAANTFSGRLTQLKNAFGDVEEKIGELLVNAIQPYIEKAVRLSESLYAVIDGTRTLTEFTQDLSAELGPVGDMLGQIILFFDRNHDALIALAGALGGVLLIAIGAATVAIIGFIGLSLPVIAAAAAIGAALALLVMHWGQVRQSVSDFVTNTVAWIQNLWVQLSTAFTNGINWLKANWAEALGWLVGFAATLPFKLPIWIIGAIVAMEKAAWDNVPKVVDVWKVVFDRLPGILWAVIVGLFDLWKAGWRMMIDFVVNINWGAVFANIGKALIGSLKGALAGITGGNEIGKALHIPGFALGTLSAPGGLAYVHQNELISLPQGSRVYNARETQQIVQQGSKGPLIGTVIVNERQDIDTLSQKLGWLLETRGAI